jgi:hypothetical protein
MGLATKTESWPGKKKKKKKKNKTNRSALLFFLSFFSLQNQIKQSARN